MLALFSLTAHAHGLPPFNATPSPLTDPHLRAKVTLQEPAATLDAVLALLTQKTQARTQLRLQANGALGRAPALCLCRNAALPDLLEALSWLFGHAWQRVADELVMEAAPTGEEADPRAAVRACGQQLLYAIDRQPLDLRTALMQNAIRIGSLPPQVQKAIQTLVSANQSQRGPHLPTDLSQAGAHLDFRPGPEHATNYTVSVTALADQPDGRTSEMTQGIFLTLPDDERISVTAANEPLVGGKGLDQPVTLALKNATLAEALRALAAQAPVNLVGTGLGPFARHADVTLVQVSLHEALDRLAQTYGCRWEPEDTGIVRLWAEPGAYQEATTRLGKTLMQQYDRLAISLQDRLTTEGMPLDRLPAPMQQTARLLAETPKPIALLTSEELTATSQTPDLAEARLRIRIEATPVAPRIHVWIGSEAMGWRAIQFIESE